MHLCSVVSQLQQWYYHVRSCTDTDTWCIAIFLLSSTADVSQGDLQAACALTRPPGHWSVSCSAWPRRHCSPLSEQWAVPPPSFASICRMETRCKHCSCTPTTLTCRKPSTPTVPMVTRINMKRLCIMLRGMAWKRYYGTVEVQFPCAFCVCVCFALSLSLSLSLFLCVYVFWFENKTAYRKERVESFVKYYY